jgi:hypothetical protein
MVLLPNPQRSRRNHERILRRHKMLSQRMIILQWKLVSLSCFIINLLFEFWYPFEYELSWFASTENAVGKKAPQPRKNTKKTQNVEPENDNSSMEIGKLSCFIINFNIMCNNLNFNIHLGMYFLDLDYQRMLLILQNQKGEQVLRRILLRYASW